MAGEGNKSVEIQILREVSDHDGYCSDGECQYGAEILTVRISIPEFCKNRASGDDVTYMGDETWFPYLPNSVEPKLNLLGSGYCTNSETVEKHNLKRHDYRLTVLKATIKDN